MNNLQNNNNEEEYDDEEGYGDEVNINNNDDDNDLTFQPLPNSTSSSYPSSSSLSSSSSSLNHHNNLLTKNVRRRNNENQQRQHQQPKQNVANNQQNQHNLNNVDVPIIPISRNPNNNKNKLIKRVVVSLFAIAIGLFFWGLWYNYSNYDSIFLLQNIFGNSKKLPYPQGFKPIPISQTGVLPANKCFLVKDDEILNRSTYETVLHSLHYYMYHDDFESITAFHVGSPICLLLLRMEDNSILEVFNPEISGFSPEAISYRQEESIACPNIKRTVSRADVLYILYKNTKNAELMSQFFQKEQSWALQSAILYLYGRSICPPYINDLPYDVSALPNILDHNYKIRGCKSYY